MSKDLAAQFQREQLHRAAADGDLAEVQRLLVAGYPVNRFDDLGKTPLHYAVAREHREIVETLIYAGANVNARDQRRIGNTPLGESAQTCSPEIAKQLLTAGADPTLPGWMGLTAIDRARKRADAKKMLPLLEDAAKQCGR